jgi:hypothetical protein
MIKQNRRSWLFRRAPMNIETRPVKLFGDRDRDGVANVFDCQPNNRRRQDGDNSDKKQKEDSYFIEGKDPEDFLKKVKQKQKEMSNPQPEY